MCETRLTAGIGRRAASRVTVATSADPVVRVMRLNVWIPKHAYAQRLDAGVGADIRRKGSDIAA
jgi:hypothetical protein